MVRLRNPFPPFLFGIPSIHSLPEAGSESCSTFRHLCILAASCPSLHCNWRKRLVACREAEGLVREFWSPRFVTMQWLCSQLCYVTAANQWTIVEIELLATVGWKCGFQPFSCLCLKNVTRSRKEIYATYLSKESIPASTFGNCKHPVPTRSFRFLRAAARSTSSALCLHHGHPFVAASEQSTCLMQRSKVTTKICYIQLYNTVISRPVLPFCPFWLHTLICLNSPELHCWLSSHPHCIKMLGLCFRVYVRRSQGAGTDPAKDSMPMACRRGARFA